MQQPHFLSIGDIVTDAFIRVQDAHVRKDQVSGNTELCLRFGDKVPYESVTVLPGVGNSPNAAVSVSRLGLPSLLLTGIGADAGGKECLAELTKNGVDTSLVYTDPNNATNYHYVLWHDIDRTILIKHAPITYHLTEATPIPAWIYFSSVGGHLESIHDEVVAYLEKNPATKLAFQPGTFQITLGVERLRKLYQHTEVFVCNVEEAEKVITTIAGTTFDTVERITDRKSPAFREYVKKMLAIVHELGPKIVAITDGPDGAFASDGEHQYFMPIYPDPKPPVERTGCGDAFASTFSVFLAKGMSLSDALLRAPINSMNVVQHIGAQEGLLTEEEIALWLTKAPENYKPESI